VGHRSPSRSPSIWFDQAAAKLGIDPAEMRKRGISSPTDAYPYKSASGMPLRGAVASPVPGQLLALMKYDELRREQSGLRKKGVYRGIGLPPLSR